jgi:hypothetical protein
MFGTPESLLPENPKTVMDISAEKLDWVLLHADNFIAGIEAFKGEALRRLEMNAHNAPKQYKLVTGKASRSWKDIHDITNYVVPLPIDAFTEPVIKSPAQMEMAFKLERLDIKTLGDFIKKKPGKPKMLHISKAGKALPPKMEAMFGPVLDPFDEIDPFS